jgi:hypothetical protein
VKRSGVASKETRTSLTETTTKAAFAASMLQRRLILEMACTTAQGLIFPYGNKLANFTPYIPLCSAAWRLQQFNQLDHLIDALEF